MKYILAATLLLSVLGLGSCARSSSKLPWMTQKWLKTVGSHENTNHRINKRQSSEDDFEYPDAECHTEITRLACQTGLWEQIVRIKLNCGNNYAVEIAAAECDRNEAGEFCGTVNSTLSNELLETAYKSCIQDPPTPSAGDSCPSPECAKSLEAIRNSPPGCCVYMYTPQYDYRYDNSLDPLWSQCGIEILEQCEQTISRSPLTDAIKCSELDEEYTTKTIMVQCSGQFNTILSQVENMDGCSQIRRGYDRICQINSQDENCYFVFNETLLNEAQNECNMNQTSCSDSCREALESFRKEQGCCFNFYYNNTIDFEQKCDYKPFLASYTLWSECGVETPPLTCRNLLSKAHSKDLAILTLVLTLLVAMWNN